MKYLKTCGAKTSADHEAAKNYIDEFAKIISDENLSPEQIYNADETALYWCYVPRKPLAPADERAPTGCQSEFRTPTPTYQQVHYSDLFKQTLSYDFT